MRLVRFGEVGAEKPGVLDSLGRRRDLSRAFRDWNMSFFGANGLQHLRALHVRDWDPFPIVQESERWGSPVARPGKIVCIGLNYSDHARESGMPIPVEPIIFLKAPNTVVGPFDNVILPRGSRKTDWEIELGVLIGEEARYLMSADEGMHHVAGYCIGHDVSERAYQLERGGQWTKGKSCDTFSPLGPFLVTTDDLPDIGALTMRLWVNGELRQNGSTATMIFGVGYLVYYLSQFMTLEPGDLLLTGTPPGVGLGMTPPTYLKAGETVELEIDHLGRQKQLFVSSE